MTSFESEGVSSTSYYQYQTDYQYLIVEMRVFVDYRKKSVEFDVKETMTVGELKERIESECTGFLSFSLTRSASDQGASGSQDHDH